MGSPKDVTERSPDVTISSSLELESSFSDAVGGFLVGKGEVFFETIRLDDNLHAWLGEGPICGGGMEHSGGVVEGAKASGG